MILHELENGTGEERENELNKTVFANRHLNENCHFALLFKTPFIHFLETSVQANFWFARMFEESVVHTHENM